MEKEKREREKERERQEKEREKERLEREKKLLKEKQERERVETPKLQKSWYNIRDTKRDTNDIVNYNKTKHATYKGKYTIQPEKPKEYQLNRSQSNLKLDNNKNLITRDHQRTDVLSPYNTNTKEIRVTRQILGRKNNEDKGNEIKVVRSKMNIEINKEISNRPNEIKNYRHTSLGNEKNTDKKEKDLFDVKLKEEHRTYKNITNKYEKRPIMSKNYSMVDNFSANINDNNKGSKLFTKSIEILPVIPKDDNNNKNISYSKKTYGTEIVDNKYKRVFEPKADTGNRNSSSKYFNQTNAQSKTYKNYTLNKSIDVVKPTGRDDNITRKEIKYTNTKNALNERNYPNLKNVTNTSINRTFGSTKERNMSQKNIYNNALNDDKDQWK